MRKCAFKVKAFFEDEEITIQENQEIVFQFQDNSESERILNFYPLKNDNKFYEVHVKALNLVDFDFTVSLKSKINYYILYAAYIAFVICYLL